MSNITLHNFDMAGGRGEEVRLALHVAGIEFEDHRIKRRLHTMLPSSVLAKICAVSSIAPCDSRMMRRKKWLILISLMDGLDLISGLNQ